MGIFGNRTSISAKLSGRKTALLAATIGAAILLSACSSTQPASSVSGFGNNDYVQVCQDPATGMRVDDNRCDDNMRGGSGSSSSPYMWYFFSTMMMNQNHMMMPRVGSMLSGGYNYNQYSQLSNTGSYYRGVPSNGGSFSRQNVTSAPVFDNSKMLKVPGDFRPPTAAPVAPAPAAGNTSTNPLPKVAPAPAASQVAVPKVAVPQVKAPTKSTTTTKTGKR